MSADSATCTCTSSRNKFILEYKVFWIRVPNNHMNTSASEWLARADLQNRFSSNKTAKTIGEVNEIRKLCWQDYKQLIQAWGLLGTEVDTHLSEQPRARGKPTTSFFLCTNDPEVSVTNPMFELRGKGRQCHWIYPNRWTNRRDDGDTCSLLSDSQEFRCNCVYQRQNSFPAGSTIQTQYVKLYVQIVRHFGRQSCRTRRSLAKRPVTDRK